MPPRSVIISGATTAGMRTVVMKKNGPHRTSHGVSLPAYLLGRPKDPPHTAPITMKVKPNTIAVSTPRLLPGPEVRGTKLEDGFALGPHLPSLIPPTDICRIP